MKISDASIVISPGLGGNDDRHWVKRWSRQMKTARFVEHANYLVPRRAEWVAEILACVEAADKPVVLVGHSLGAISLVHAAPELPKDRIVGAFLVAPSDWEREGLVPGLDYIDFDPIPREPLPFKSQLVASRNDPYCDFNKSLELARHWGSYFIDAGEAGHINVDSGQGPWPEGLTAFALFMKTL